jgi:predicted dehydrogenase
MRFAPAATVRLAMIGVGGRGTFLLEEFLATGNVRVSAICDLSSQNALAAAAAVEKAGQPAPALYSRGEYDFENLCRRHDIDLVVVATPWKWHVPMAIGAMLQGKHVAVEVPAATTVEDCWKLVHTSERTRRHCVMLENCCYGYTEMLVLNLVRAGKLGELTHGAAGYLHDLRPKLLSETHWMRDEYLKRNGNLYPTHGLGPIAQYMNINRGDRFDRLTSMSSAARSLSFHRDRLLQSGRPAQRREYLCGDQNTSLIRTARGRLITLEHNVSSPEPYDRINLIAGVSGIFRDYPPRLFIDGETVGDAWAPLDPYKSRYEHPFWTRMGDAARKSGGHDGMDFLMCYRLIECMREGLVPDMDVYDAAALSAPAPLSELSVAEGKPVSFPDFTRGRWLNRSPET